MTWSYFSEKSTIGIAKKDRRQVFCLEARGNPVIDLPALKRRCRLPRGALSKFVELNRRGIESVTVWLLDGLAPSEHARGTFVSRSGGSISDMIARLLSLF